MEKMKIRGRVGSSWWSFGSKLGLPAVFLLCSFFFLAGFFGFMLLSQEGVSGLRPTPRLLELVDEAVEFDPLTHGQTGESSVTSIPFQILSWKPRAVYFPHFATVAQCQIMIKMAKAQLAPSTLALREGETAENTKGIRTSSGMFISAFEDKTGTLDLIEEKIARATMIPKNHGESHYSSMLSSYTSDLDLDLPRVDAEFILMMPKLGRLIPELREGFLNIRTADAITRRGYLQNKSRTASVLSHGPSNDQAFNILRYEIGQRYNSHYDAFNPAEYGPQKSQRIASFLLYLSDVEEGGETMFPFENGLPMDLNYDYRKCVGLKIKPRIGDGLLFYSLFPNGTIDATSLHGSCPVITGQKWVATKWIRNQEQDD